MNFNIDYIDYSNYSNFNEFYNEIDNYNNNYLKEFMETDNFNEKTKNIFNYLTFKKKESKIIVNKTKLKEYGKKDWFTLEKITEFISFVYGKKPKFINLNEIKINFNEELFGYHYSPEKKRIYAYLAHKKLIYIFNFNSEENIIELTDEIIEITEPGNFNRCIHIKDNCLLVIDDKSIYLFYKNNLNNQKFINTNKITFEDEIFDALKIDDKYSLISHKSKLTFISTENLKIEKVINNIDCLDEYDILTPIKECILVNCVKGIAMISIKNKEMIQYIFDFDNLGDKTITVSDNFIYILNSLGILLKYSFFDYNLILKEKTEIEKPDEKNFYFKNMNLLFKKGNIYLCDTKIYILEK